ncbi:MAG: hypothetical protein HY736_12180, partial [Verrucomicrobia bacterium]|nr:hypothetical protein [Verrucomicrobiota bacterium]
MTGRGKFVLTLLILAIAGVGAYKWWDRLKPGAASAPAAANAGSPAAATAATKAAKLNAADFIEPLTACPLLPPAGAYVPKDNTLDLE